MICPALPLSLLVFASALAGVIEELAAHRRRERLRRLATQWKMNFTRRDLFQLASRVRKSMPFPDVRKLRVCDVIYGLSDQHRRFIFTLEYVSDRGWQALRVRRVMALSEPREAPGPLELPASAAPEHLPIIEQYAHLLAQG